MIRLADDIHPSQDALTKLQEYQDAVDREQSFLKRSKKAKSSFSSKNNKRNKTFQEVKRALTALCNSTRRCV
ncbi:MAG: hypothetical protein AAGC88_04710, partial [Bacteroidota bacterium]